MPASLQSSNDLVQRAQRKAVPDITETKYGYTIHKSEEEVTLLLGQQWIIKRSGIEVDILEIDIENRKVTVTEAANDFDTAPNRIKLRGIILSVWEAKTSLKAKDLRQIFWSTIINMDIDDSVDRALALIPDKSTRVLPLHKDAYEEIMTKNPAGKGITKMLDGFVGMEGKSVIAIDIDKTKSYRLTFWLSE